jgi:GT2 family glycosyltransferase
LPILQALTDVDLVTVSTRPLQEYVLPYNPNVVVLPNYLNDDLWRLRPPVPFVVNKDIVVIGYMGGTTHMPDIDMIVPALLELDRRHPGKLLFRFWGIQPPIALRSAPNVQWSSADSPSYPGFAKFFQGQTADIFIGPLRDNLFNVCKSPIKYFEYSALGAPGIFSRIPPYSSVIEDGFNGLLASSLSDWTEALNRLIEDSELRLMIARNAQENIRSNWLLSNNAERWLEVYTMAVKVAAGGKAPASDFSRLVRSLACQVAEGSDNKTQEPRKEQEPVEIKMGNVSRIPTRLRRVRLRLAPPGSLQARLARKFFSPWRAPKVASELSLISDSKLFNASWYLANNRDVAESGMNPALHYLQFGGFEGRDPSPKFNSSWYLAAYKDVEQTRMNPLLHYIKRGRNEGRSPLPQQEGGRASRNTGSKNTPGHKLITRYLSSSYFVWKAEGFQGIRRRFSWGLDKIFSTWKKGGPMLVWEKVRFRLGRPVLDSFSFHPQLIFPADAISSEDKQRQDIENFHFKPLISILIPVYNTPPRYLAAAIDSICRQTYTNFEICICDDGSSDSTVTTELKRISAQDQRIKLFTFRKNSGISAATNKAAELANGDFYAFMDHDDELTSDALFETVRMLNQDPFADVVYSDQDKIDAHGLFSELFYKPDWSPEYFRSAMYVGHLLVVKKDLFHQVGGMLSRFDGVQDYEFMLRVSEIARRIRHIPKILYHWRKIPGSIALSVDEKGDRIEELQVKAVSDQLQRLNILATVTINPSHRHRVIILPKPRLNFPLVSIIVLAGKVPQSMERCVGSIIQRTSYPNYEVVVVVNQTADKTPLKEVIDHPVKVVTSDEEFSFSRASNLGIQNAQGEFVVLLDSDTEVVTVEWIEVLLSYLERKGVGAVGSMLIYPDHTVQHAGIALGISGTADNLMRHFPYISDGFAGSLCCPREVSAVTSACMMLKRQDYVELGGLVEHYATQYQDVDLCLRIQKTGKRILYVPHAVLIRYESHTKGKALNEPMDRALFLDVWGDIIARGDPYYNPHFSLDAGDYSFKGRSGV